MSSVRLDRALRCSVVEGALATVMSSLLGGVFLTGFALYLGASRLQIGILASIPAFANLAQLGGAYFIEQTGRSKRLCMIMTWAGRLLWLPILLVPAVMRNYSGVSQVWCVIGLLTVAWLCGSVGGVAWLAWIKRLVPRERQLSLFSKRHLFNTGLALTMSIAGALVLDGCNHYLPGSVGGFLVVFAAAMTCGLIGVWILGQMPEVETPDHQPRPFLKSLARPLQDHNFRRLVLFYSVWNLSTNLAAPFFTVYMLQKMQLPFWAVTLLATLSSVAGLGMNRFWTRLKQKFGIRPVVLLATLGDAFMPLCWLLVGPQAIWLLLPIHLFGVFSAPLAMGPNNLVLKLAPEKNSSPYLAVFSALTGPVTAIGAILGGVLAGSLAGEWQIGAVSMTGLQLLFLISGCGRLLSLGLLFRVTEPQAEPVAHIFRVLHRAGNFRREKRRRLAAGPEILTLPKPKAVPAVAPQRVAA
jgi:Na+/melibiose symporter-like transporter